LPGIDLVYRSAGAVADLFDVSCNYRTIGFSNITNATFDLWSESSIPWQTTNAPLLGHHYFVHPTPGAAIAPEWDFTTTGVTKGNANAYVIGAKDVSVAGAHPTVDVPSLQLHNISGKLATSIYRLATVNGQPPANCSGSGSLFVKYTALYGESTCVLPSWMPHVDAKQFCTGTTPELTRQVSYELVLACYSLSQSCSRFVAQSI
jgi:hypothetical protein